MRVARSQPRLGAEYPDVPETDDGCLLCPKDAFASARATAPILSSARMGSADRLHREHYSSPHARALAAAREKVLRLRGQPRIDAAHAYCGVFKKLAVDGEMRAYEARQWRALIGRRDADLVEIGMWLYTMVAGEGLSREDILRGIDALHALIAEGGKGAELAAGALSLHYKFAAPTYYEIVRWGEELFAFIERDSSSVCVAAAQALGSLVKQLAPGAPLVATWMRRLRERIAREEGIHRLAGTNVCACTYHAMFPYLAQGSAEIYEGAAWLRSLFSAGFASDRLWALNSYLDISWLFSPRDAGCAHEMRALAATLLPLYRDDVARERLFIPFQLKSNFHHLYQLGFWNHALEGTWLKDAGFSDPAIDSMRGLVAHKHVVSFMEHWQTVLECLRMPSPHKMRVVNAVYEATDVKSWKAIRSTLETLRLLLSVENLPSAYAEKIYAGWARDPRLTGDPRGWLRGDVRRALAEYLVDTLALDGDARAMVEMLPSMKSDDAHRERLRAINTWLVERDLMNMCVRAATFMKETGKRMLSMFLAEYADAAVVRGVPEYRQRYERMQIRLGFAPAFVATWKNEWRETVTDAAQMSDEEGRRVVIDQALSQLRTHIDGVPHIEGPVKDVPARVQAFIARLARDEATVNDAEELRENIEARYATIRTTYGDVFANIRMDLKALVLGLTKGPRRGGVYEVCVTGAPDAMAQVGMVPIATCQRLTQSTGFNVEGEPLTRILWGQFKVANFLIDGEVAARRMIEATRDAEGQEHLRVEHVYVAGSFVYGDAFVQMIERYAEGVGIPKERVHFLDRPEGIVAPPPLKTGDPVYRDSGGVEVDPPPAALVVPPASPVGVMPSIPPISSVPSVPTCQMRGALLFNR